MTDTGRDYAEESRAFEYRIGDEETVIEAVLHAVSEVTDRRLPLGIDGLRSDEPGSDESGIDGPGIDGPGLNESGADGAKTTDGERERVPPLYDVVDPDALVALSTSATTDVTITFSYAGCHVTVVGTDAVLVSHSSSPTDSGD